MPREKETGVQCLVDSCAETVGEPQHTFLDLNVSKVATLQAGAVSLRTPFLVLWCLGRSSFDLTLDRSVGSALKNWFK